MTHTSSAVASVNTRRGGTLLFLDGVSRMAVGFVIATLLARQYGPEGLGLITTSISLVTIVMGFSALGLSGVLVRELINTPESQGRLLLTVLVGKAVVGAALLAGLLAAISTWSAEPSLAKLSLIIGLGFLFTSFDPADALYNARTEFPRLIALRITGLGCSTLLKVAAIQFDWGLEYVAVGYALDYALMYGLPTVDLLVRRSGGTRSGDIALGLDFRELARLVQTSWPVLVSGGFAQINLKIDTVIIASMTSVSSVGLYSAAARLSEAWSVLAMALVGAAFPVLVRLFGSSHDAYVAALSALLRKLIWLSIAGAAVVAVASPMIIRIVYGAEFSASATILSIHVVGGVFLFVRTAVSRWLIVEGLLPFSLVSHASGAAMNIVLNLILIPRFGITGAACASVVSYGVSGVGFLACTRRTRPMFHLILWSAIPGRWSSTRINAVGRSMDQTSKGVS